MHKNTPHSYLLESKRMPKIFAQNRLMITETIEVPYMRAYMHTYIHILYLTRQKAKEKCFWGRVSLLDV